MQKNLLGIFKVYFEVAGQLLIIYSVFVKYLRKIGIERSSASAIYNFKKIYDSVTREGLYNILTDSGNHMKFLRLVKMWLIETYSKVRIGKNLLDIFPIKNGLKKNEILYSNRFSTLL
jgi:hypothetical protein